MVWSGYARMAGDKHYLNSVALSVLKINLSHAKCFVKMKECWTFISSSCINANSKEARHLYRQSFLQW
jgi:hypothetical protein